MHADTSSDELFTLFSEIVKPLYDAHVTVFDAAAAALREQKVS